ncbi:MAG: hypothetical protein ACQKBU_03600, partial [Verrucomicrobiales bacterium]
GYQTTETTLELILPNTETPEDITLSGETSINLVDWTETGVTETEDGYSVLRDGPQRFLRTRITLEE